MRVFEARMEHSSRFGCIIYTIKRKTNKGSFNF